MKTQHEIDNRFVTNVGTVACDDCHAAWARLCKFCLRCVTCCMCDVDDKYQPNTEEG